MNYKIFGIFLCTLVTVHANQLQLILKALEDEDTSVKDIVVKFGDVALDIADIVLKTSDEVIHFIDTHKEILKEAIEEAVIENIETYNELFFELLNSLKYGATNDGEDILDCLIDEEDQLHKAIKKPASALGICISDVYYDILPIPKEIVRLSLKLKESLRNDINALKVCHESEEKCLRSFAHSVIKKIIKISNIAKVELNFIELCEAFVFNMSECIVGQLWNGKQCLQRSFNDAAVCIKQQFI